MKSGKIITRYPGAVVMIVLIIIHQVLFILSCTIWSKVVDFPGILVCPDMTREYLEQYFDAPPGVPYDDQLFYFFYYVKPAMFLIFTAYIIYNMCKLKTKMKIGRRIDWAVFTAAAILCLILVVIYQHSYDLYYLYKSLVFGEIVSFACAVFIFTKFRYSKPLDSTD